VDRDEYEALCALRDGVYDQTRIRLDAALENTRAAEHLVAKHAVTIESLRAKNLEQHTLIISMMRRLAELEPVRSSVPQPAFARSRP